MLHPRLARRRGFTIIELLVYFSLVTTAMVVFGGIELGAQRTVDMQHALIDINTHSQSYLFVFRRDVEAARTLKISRESLTVERLDGVKVVYRGIERREMDASGKERGRHVFRRLKKLTFEPGPAGGVSCTIELGITLGRTDVIERTFRRVAIPRRVK